MSIFKPDNQDDLVSRAERVANNVGARLEATIERLIEAVPRPIGAEKVSYEDELNEYIQGVAGAPDPRKSANDLLNQWQQQYGKGGGLKRFIEYVERNEKRLHDIVDKGK